MKKIVSLILVACLACMLIPAMAEGVVGTWYLVEMQANGAVVNPAQMGINWTMVFNEDGTAENRMEMMGQVQEASGTWTMEGDTITFTVEGNPATMQLVDGKLSADMNGQTAVFSQEAPAAVEKPAVVAAESEEAFFGDWELCAIDMMNMYMEKSMLGMAGMEWFNVKLSIEAGKAAMTSKVSQEAEEETQIYDTRFEDGKLVIEIDLSAAESIGLDLSSITDGISTIELLENGDILYGMNFMGVTIGVYLTKVEAPGA